MNFQCVVVATNSYHLFNTNKWIEGGVQLVTPNRGVRDLLGRLRKTSCIFKTLINFTLPEFEKLHSLVYLVIGDNASFTSAF